MNTSSGKNSSRTARNARAEASVWIVKLHGEDRSAELEAGLREWLSADPENARQFEYMSDVWELGGTVTADRLPRMRSWHSTAARARWIPASVVTALCVGALLALYFNWTRSFYVTEHGEQRLVRLQDGSTVYLNSDSRLRVDFDSTTRRVSLERGEGLFEVAKDARHRFVVDAGSRHVTALGTTFVVRYEPTRTAITLVEGKVAVSSGDEVEAVSQPSSAADTAMTPVTLVPGERLVLVRNSAPRVDTPRMDAVTAWRRGQVVLDATALRDAVSEMNRYDRRRLVIDDAGLESVHVSGVYQTGDSLGFAQAIAELHHLAVREDSGEIHLYSQGPSKHSG